MKTYQAWIIAVTAMVGVSILQTCFTHNLYSKGRKELEEVYNICLERFDKDGDRILSPSELELMKEELDVNSPEARTK